MKFPCATSTCLSLSKVYRPGRKVWESGEICGFGCWRGGGEERSKEGAGEGGKKEEGAREGG